MIRATLKCAKCEREQTIEYDDSFTREMVDDHCALVAGKSRFFTHTPKQGNPAFSSTCCVAEILWTITEQVE